MKVKVDVKQLCIEHGEKGALGLCGLLMGYFALSAFSLESYPRLPEDFSTLARSTRSLVEGTPPEDLSIGDLPAKHKETRQPVPAGPYWQQTKWRWQHDYGDSPRLEPSILTPAKPLVRDNHGFYRRFKSDESLRRITRKVKDSEARYPVDPAMKSILARVRPDARGATAWMAMYEGRGELPEGSQLGRATVPDQEAAAAELAGEMDERQKMLARFKTLQQLRDQLKKKGATTQKTKVIEEWVVEPVGVHWVEVLATFPHSDQIREYTEALHEDAQETLLAYAFADVQRRELGTSFEWSDWQPIPLGRQLDAVLNAESYEPDPLGNVLCGGLAMKLPRMLPLTMGRDLLSANEFDKPAEFVLYPSEMGPGKFCYEDRHWHPRAWAEYQRELKEFQKGPRRAVPPPPPDRQEAKGAAAEKEGAAATPAGAAGQRKAEFDNGYRADKSFIRFWDFTVQPGRRYQYRVRVHAINPNWGLRDQVAEVEFAKKELLSGGWSEPSDDVYVETDTRWFITEDRLRGSDPRADIEVHAWNPTVGVWLLTKLDQRPGDILGVPVGGKAKPVPTPVWGADELDISVAERNLPKGTFDARSVLLAVDRRQVRPSGKTSRPIDLPTEVIAVNQFGDLVRRDAVGDAADPFRLTVAQGYDSLVNEFKLIKQQLEADAKAEEEEMKAEDAGGEDADNPLRKRKSRTKEF